MGVEGAKEAVWEVIVEFVGAGKEEIDGGNELAWVVKGTLKLWSVQF